MLDTQNIQNKRLTNIAAKDYWLDENREIATREEDHAYLLIREGQEVTETLAAKYPAIETRKVNR